MQFVFPEEAIVSEVKVHARPIQSIVVTKQLTCSDGAGLGALRAIISKGADPYEIVWTGAFNYHMEDSLEITGLKGQYVLNVTDNLGCNSKDTITLNPVYAQPSIQAQVIPPGNFNLSCVGSTDGTILLSVSAGITAPYTYTLLKNDVEVVATGVLTGIFTGFGNPTTYRSVNNLGAGSYTLVITDVNMCEASQQTHGLESATAYCSTIYKPLLCRWIQYFVQGLY